MGMLMESQYPAWTNTTRPATDSSDVESGSSIGIGTLLTERPSHTTNRTDLVVSGSAVIDRFDQAEQVRETE
jgi:hypothetical protein